MSDMQIGSGKSGGTGGKKKTFVKLKDGDSVYRILPALGDAVKTNTWSEYWNIHYGYKNTQGYLRTFQSPLVKNNKTKMIEVPDAALEFIDTIKAEIAKQKAAGAPKSTIDKLEEIAGGRKSRFNLDSNHYMNAVDLEGNIVILKIRHRAKQALDALFKKLEATGVYPMSPTDGRYIVFSRTGMGLDTSFAVSVYQENVEINGKTYKEDKVHALTPDLISRLSTDAGKLSELFKCPTAEEVAAIVKACDPYTGISAAVDAILDTKPGENSDETPSGSGDYQTPAPTAQAPSPAAANILASIQPQVTQPTAPVAQAAPVQAPVQQVAPAPASVAVPVSAAPVAPAPVYTPPVQQPAVAASVLETSDADFLKSLGVKTG